MNPKSLSPLSEEERQRLAYRVAQLFIGERDETEANARKAQSNLADHVVRQIKEEFGSLRFTRETVYPMMAEAVRYGFLVLMPPFEVRTQDALIRKYPHLAESIHVVQTANHLDSKKVSIAAAKIALDRAKRIASHLRIKTIGLGLGPGRATRDFCEGFGQMIATDSNAPRLDLFAITAGCPAEEPEYASISFFNQFEDRIVSRRVGLFAETLVQGSDLKKIRNRAGVKEAIEARNCIHMVVTSMGDMNDREDLLRLFLEQSKVDISSLLDRGWIGNVQYRPYTKNGPVKEKKTDLRAVTLFELEDLVQMAKRDDRSVILIARQCSRCKRTRAKALEPLLKEDQKLRVFSDLVVDAATAQELLNST